MVWRSRNGTVAEGSVTAARRTGLALHAVDHARSAVPLEVRSGAWTDPKLHTILKASVLLGGGEAWSSR